MFIDIHQVRSKHRKFCKLASLLTFEKTFQVRQCYIIVIPAEYNVNKARGHEITNLLLITNCKSSLATEVFEENAPNSVFAVSTREYTLRLTHE